MKADSVFKKRFIAIILVAIVLFSACTNKEGSSQNYGVADYPLSQTELDAINEAWDGGNFADSVQDVGYLSGKNYIYGKYGEIIVLGWSGMLAECSEINVSGYLFKFPTNGGIRIYSKGKIYKISEAYENNILSDIHIKELWELHNVHILQNPEYLITESELECINAAWGEKGFAENIADIEKYGGAGSFIYGRYNGCIVIGKYSESAESLEYTVADCKFVFEDSVLKVYLDGQLYALADAYKNKFLTDENIKKISELHDKCIIRKEGALTSEQLQFVNEIWGENGFADKTEDVVFRKKSESFVYAQYNDCIVLGKTIDSGENTEYTISGYKFELPSMVLKVLLINEYKLCSLEEAYLSGIFTEVQLYELWKLHNQQI